MTTKVKHFFSWCITLFIIIMLWLTSFPFVLDYEEYWDAQRHSSLSECVKYNKMYIKSQSGNDFTVISGTTRSCGNILMTWRDSAYFFDANNDLIPRTIPCNPEYGIELSSKVCEPNGWHQYQWWQELDLNQGRVIEPWIYKQTKIPANAVTMGIISFQKGVLYDGYFGKVERSQVVKTSELYHLSN